MNYCDYVKQKLKSFTKKDIIINEHALIRAIQRQITEEEIIQNLLEPTRLTHAIKETGYPGEKFDCYFSYSKTLCHRYIIVIKSKVIVITVIKINRRWQQIAEDKLNKTQ